MIYLIFSDVHSNLESLNKFIEISTEIPHDKKVCLGDMVGYNANPNECLDWIRQNVDIVLAGNHDYGAVGMIDISEFNPFAQEACLWSKEQLTDANRMFLRSLPIVKEEDGILWAHSSPFEPDEWHYINNKYDAQNNFPHFKNSICFVGHSHKLGVYELELNGWVEGIYQFDYELKLGCRYIVNVGSLGQPRDGIPKPSFVIFNSSTLKLEIIRYEYNFNATQSKVISEGLPSYLAERLAMGF